MFDKSSICFEKTTARRRRAHRVGAPGGPGAAQALDVRRGRYERTSGRSRERLQVEKNLRPVEATVVFVKCELNGLELAGNTSPY